MSSSRVVFSRGLSGAALCALALLAGAPAAAAEEGRWSVAAQVGQASVQGEFGVGIRGWDVDDEGTAGGVEVGYLLHPNLGVQAGYRDLGRYQALNRRCPAGTNCRFDVEGNVVDEEFLTFAPVEAELTALSLVAVPRWPVTDRFALYGKLGLIDWEGEIAFAPSVGGGVLDRPSGQDLLGGLGAAYTFPRGLGVQLEVETTDLFDQASLGASWRF